jgi:hypothetical protein
VLPLKTLIMKSLKFFSGIILLSCLGLVSEAQTNGDEKLNLPGDNLNLYAVMNLFQESETLEGFEKNLNAEDSKINNLDLNADDKTDYIKVLDYIDGEIHTIVLQVAVNEKENQDVAVFTVQKDANNQVQVQLIGDEQLYGKDYIIEPIYDDASSGSTPNPGYKGNTNTVEKETVVVTKTTYVEVAAWPVVTYIYTPAYVVYRSPWYWGYYPPYWNPWRPFYWDYYYGYHSHYHHHYYGYYRPAHYYRYPQYNNNYYHGHRAYSNTVYQHRQSGTYRNTYSHPETRNQGSADFNKRYPNGYQPAARPTNVNNSNRPSAKPGTNTNTTRPTTKPATNTNVSRPTTKPGTGTTTRPTTKPSTGNNGSRPATNPSTKPATGKPSSRPATVNPSSKPANSKETVKNATRDAAKPAINKPASKPSTARPAVKPTTKTPTPQQKTTKQTAPPRNSKPDSKSSTGTR